MPSIAATRRCRATVSWHSELSNRPSPELVVISGKRHVPRRVGDRFEVTITLIETRGEGGLFLCDPTPGYTIEQGSFDQLADPDRGRTGDPDRGGMRAERVGPAGHSAIAAARPRWAGLATTSTSGATCGKCCAGTAGNWCAAARTNTGVVPAKSRAGARRCEDGVLYVFSRNAAPFEPDRAYAPFTVLHAARARRRFRSGRGRAP